MTDKEFQEDTIPNLSVSANPSATAWVDPVSIT
jgi:hypothetical protein